MELKVYVDRLSQPSRAILIFCKVNGIDFEEVEVSLAQRQHIAPEYAEINPMKQVPAIAHGDFKLFESHAILTYLASAFPSVADHWYPADLCKRAKVQSILDWHHSNLRRGSVGLIMNTVLGPILGFSMDPKAAAEGEKLLSASLSTIESFWLKGKSQFLLDADQPSLADLALVCEIMQLEFLGEEHKRRILKPHKKVQKWIENTKRATNPHFDEVHQTLYGVQEIIQVGRSAGATQESGSA